MLQTASHYGIHFIVPLIVAFVYYKKNSFFVILIMYLTMLIDIDHLLATPIFDPNRCSINLHPLHSYAAIVGYVVLLFYKKTRVLGLGLCIHIIADTVDCLFM